MLKKSIHGLFSAKSKKCDFFFSTFFKHWGCLKNGGASPHRTQAAEKQLFQQPANLPLAGVTVVVTRPAHQAQGLHALIESRGGSVILFPVLEIQDTEDTGPVRALIERLDGFDMAIFISANAVHKALPMMTARKPLPSRLRLVTVGESTAKALQKYGRSPDLCPREQSNSEALLALPEMQQVRGKNIVIFRGEGGRELLGETLRQRGASVVYAEVYRRAKPATDPGNLQDHLQRGKVDVISVTSNAGLVNLLELAGPAVRNTLLATPLVVMSERNIKHARRLGFAGPIAMAKQASDAGLAEAIEDLVKARTTA
jgi:uroporphyrinogen-III synthase